MSNQHDFIDIDSLIIFIYVFSLILNGDLPCLFIIENRLIQFSCIPTLIIKDRNL
jgi:hypothetical protein